MIDALAASEFATVPEAGRLIVQEQLATGGEILPWSNMNAFIERLSTDSIKQFDCVNGLDKPVFFDRGIIEALAYWRLHDPQMGFTLHGEIGDRRYCDPVFVAPPWSELFVSDMERQHDFSAATVGYHSICDTLTDLMLSAI